MKTSQDYSDRLNLYYLSTRNLLKHLIIVEMQEVLTQKGLSYEAIQTLDDVLTYVKMIMDTNPLSNHINRYCIRGEVDSSQYRAYINNDTATLMSILNYFRGNNNVSYL